MEKQTRMSKYKELRETLNDEVAIQHQERIDVVEDDDFLAFISKKEEKNLEDTLIEPKTFETLDRDAQVKDALNEAKVTVGKEAYNTRLDILSKIRNEEIKQEVKPVKEEVSEPNKKMSLLERLAAMSPQEDVEELKEYQKEEKREEKVEEVKEERVDKVIVVDDDDDEDDEKESKLVTFLNYVIIVFMIVFVILVFFIIKELLF